MIFVGNVVNSILKLVRSPRPPMVGNVVVVVDVIDERLTVEDPCGVKEVEAAREDGEHAERAGAHHLGTRHEHVVAVLSSAPGEAGHA